MKAPMVFLVAALSLAASEGPPLILCGRRLSEALKFLCPKNEKRSKWDNFLENASLDGTEFDRELYDKWEWPWLVPKAEALMDYRGKRGVIDECCFKSCSREELLTYCPTK